MLNKHELCEEQNHSKIIKIPSLVFKTTALLFLFTMYGQIMHALTYGSDTAVTRFGTNLFFPNTDSNNIIEGFGAVENGFTIQDYTTTLTFNGLYPVSGSINLTDGRMILLRDLVFSATTRLLALGTIIGNGHVIYFPPSLNNLTGSQAFRSVLSNNPRSVAWSGDNQYLAEVGINNPEIAIFYFSGLNLTSTLNGTVGAYCNSVGWPLNGNYFEVGLATGTGEIKSYYLNTSNGTLTNTQSLTITPSATVRAFAFTQTGSFMAVGRRGTTGPVDEPGVGTATSQLAVFAYNSPGPGWATLLSTTGLPTPGGVSNDGMVWSPDGQYLLVGTDYSASSPEALIYYFNGTTLSLTASLSLDGRARGIDWSPTYSFIAIGLEGSISGSSLVVYQSILQSGALSLSQVLAYPEPKNVLSVRWSPDGNSLIAGTTPASGSPALSTCTTYDFTPTPYTLNARDILLFSADVRNVRWSRSGQNFSFSSTPYLSVQVVGGVLNIDNGVLILNGNTTINAKINFSGDCTLIGNNVTADMNQTGILKVTPGSSLLIENVEITGITNNSLLCMDDLATISFDHVTLTLSTNYSFTKGHFDILSDLTVRGSQVFLYQSGIPSTIQSHASLVISPGSGIAYLPSTNRNDLIQLTDRTSTIMLTGASLYSSSTGLSLTQGRCILDGKVTIGSAAETYAEAITFGDGISQSNDLTIILLPSAQLSVTTGYVVNNNIA